MAYINGKEIFFSPSITMSGDNEVLKGLIGRTAEHFEVPEGITKVGEGAFYSCKSLKSVVIPEGITTLGERCFYYCTGVEDFDLPQTLKNIHVEAFRYCAFERIFIPHNVSGLSDRAFGSCTKCIEYNFSTHTDIPTLRNDVFSGINESAKIIVPEDLFLQWINATNWVNYQNYITTEKGGFRINGLGNYMANVGMTWGEWVASDYSKGDFYITENNTIFSKIVGYEVYIYDEIYNGSYPLVHADDVISKELIYYAN